MLVLFWLKVKNLFNHDFFRMQNRNSTIKKKKCKCGCDKYPSFGYPGYFSAHLPEELRKAHPERYQKSRIKRNKAQGLNKISREVHSFQQQKNWASITLKMLLDTFYTEKRRKMTGKCIECGAKTNVEDDKYYRWSICHIVPKSLVPSVATNLENWIELCQNCHEEFDNTFEKAANMKCFEEAKRKFELFKHLIPADELRKVSHYLTSE